MAPSEASLRLELPLFLTHPPSLDALRQISQNFALPSMSLLENIRFVRSMVPVQGFLEASWEGAARKVLNEVGQVLDFTWSIDFKGRPGSERAVRFSSPDGAQYVNLRGERGFETVTDLSLSTGALLSLGKAFPAASDDAYGLQQLNALYTDTLQYQSFWEQVFVWDREYAHRFPSAKTVTSFLYGFTGPEVWVYACSTTPCSGRPCTSPPSSRSSTGTMDGHRSVSGTPGYRTTSSSTRRPARARSHSF